MQVRCRCEVTRKIDPAKVGPWRLRCKQCGDILYDPSAAAPAMPARPMTETDPTQESAFQRRLHESAELKVMMSSDGTEGQPCPRHRGKKIIAACTRCADLLCNACLDKIGDEFVCSRCIADVATGAPSDRPGGIMGFFRRLFGGS